MRHLRSILYALVLAPAVWVLCGVGFTGDLIGRARDTSGSIESLIGVLMLLLAGAAYAILVFSPISPAGPLLTGLAFLGAGLWALAEPASYAAQWPPSLSREGFDVSLPGYGLAFLLAVPMICTGLSVRRWARYEPPVLPVIGALGRARVAGTPIAVSETTVLPAPGPAPRPTPELPTQLLGVPAVEPPTAAEPTLVVAPSIAAVDDGGEATTVLPTAPATESDDEPTLQAAAQDDGEATALLSPPTEPATAAAPPVLSSTAAPDGDEATTLLPASPVNAEPQGQRAEARRDETSEADTSGLDLGRRIRDFGPGEKTQVIARNPGETTQVIRSRGAIYPPPGETTRAIRTKRDAVEPSGERTQVIKVPAPPADAPLPAAQEPAAQQQTVEHPAGQSTMRLPGAASTAERPMTVQNMERPPDEAEEDTRPLDAAGD